MSVTVSSAQQAPCEGVGGGSGWSTGRFETDRNFQSRPCSGERKFGLNVPNEEESSICYEHRTTKRSELVAEIQTTDANEFILSRLANGSNQKICPSSLV